MLHEPKKDLVQFNRASESTKKGAGYRIWFQILLQLDKKPKAISISTSYQSINISMKNYSVRESTGQKMYALEPNSIIPNTVHGESLIHCRHFAIDGEMAARRISMLKLQGSLAT